MEGDRTGTRVTELTPDQREQLRMNLDELIAACDEHGFVLRMPIDEERSAAIEPLLYGAARLHVYRNENLGQTSDRIYDYGDVRMAIFGLGELCAKPDREPSGWRRRYVDGVLEKADA